MLQGVLARLPLTEADKQRVVGKFVSVTRATLKGTILIGAAQGLLGGLAFWAVGIDGAIFWGTVMTVLSIIPGVGGALVWLPAAIILITTGEVWRGIALALFCALIVGSLDNALRPRLVGQDTKMHDCSSSFDTRRTHVLRRHGYCPDPIPRGPLRHRVGNVRHGVPISSPNQDPRQRTPTIVRQTQLRTETDMLWFLVAGISRECLVSYATRIG